MHVHDNGTDNGRHALAIDIWENEGGTSGRDSMDHHYGRRVEADGTWSIYHVFTGVPADIGGGSMTGLSRSAATTGMTSLNLRNEHRRRQRVEGYARMSGEIGAARS
ncbi:hypothetical protein [Kumtagia ephedrae]|jgi:hypothetical protein|uniref:Uncharacterized protein n=1 Tax=Kumtagia ephedrae TaxID=2116701 RepID=A0A2P7S2S2_9HYPH|nr:hypothetical protein [Mesorhizobium ephedrae]PSJ56753.1 hypothetical protein C7I84_19815 [Mesorhizobium ephedrae]